LGHLIGTTIGFKPLEAVMKYLQNGSHNIQFLKKHLHNSRGLISSNLTTEDIGKICSQCLLMKDKFEKEGNSIDKRIIKCTHFGHGGLSIGDLYKENEITHRIISDNFTANNDNAQTDSYNANHPYRIDLATLYCPPASVPAIIYPPKPTTLWKSMDGIIVPKSFGVGKNDPKGTNFVKPFPGRTQHQYKLRYVEDPLWTIQADRILDMGDRDEWDTTQ
jgi:hypothetical protein